MENKKIWVITDTHLYHKNIIEYENRPENYNELILENWRAMVGMNDMVLHLGDVIFRQAHMLNEILGSLPGLKILTMGNHDNRTGTMAWFEKRGFEHVCREYVIDDIVFSHKPIDMTSRREKYNIHGHFHTKSHSAGTYPYYDDARHIKLAIEEEEYKPVLLTDILSRRNK